jgi:hypothetical protein
MRPSLVHGVCLGVRDVKLRDVRNYIPFAHMAIMCYDERGFKDMFRPMRQFLVSELHFKFRGPPG